MLKEINIEILSSLKTVIAQLSDAEYSAPIKELSDASIGKHCRHIIDFYHCLFNNSDDVICYDYRSREVLVETQTNYSISQINNISRSLLQASEDKKVILQQQYGNRKISIPTTFKRELLYNIEHTIHHLAMIKIGLQISFPEIKIPENFGIAYSTLSHLASTES